MPGKCFVPNCKSGYDSCKIKYSVFRVPLDMTEIWNKAIPRSDRKLGLNDRVCERHFAQDNIIREWISEDGLTRVPYQIPRLKKGAVPTIFPGCPSYLSKNVRKRKLPTTRNVEPPTKLRKSTLSGKGEQNSDIPPEIDLIPKNSFQYNEENTFENLWISPEQVNFPGSTWGFHKIETVTNSRFISFSNIELSTSPSSNIVPSLERVVLVSEDLCMQFFVRKIPYTSDTWKWKNKKLLSISNLQEIIEDFSNLIICWGGPTVAIYPASKIGADSTAIAHIDNVTNRWRHNNCTNISHNSHNSCESCSKISVHFDRQLKRKTIRLAIRNTSTNEMYYKYKLHQDKSRKQRIRALHSISKLTEKLEDLKDKYKMKKTQAIKYTGTSTCSNNGMH